MRLLAVTGRFRGHRLNKRVSAEARAVWGLDEREEAVEQRGAAKAPLIAEDGDRPLV
jgi:hypothetical protein